MSSQGTAAQPSRSDPSTLALMITASDRKTIISLFKSYSAEEVSNVIFPIHPATALEQKAGSNASLSASAQGEYAFVDRSKASSFAMAGAQHTGYLCRPQGEAVLDVRLSKPLSVSFTGSLHDVFERHKKGSDPSRAGGSASRPGSNEGSPSTRSLVDELKLAFSQASKESAQDDSYDRAATWMGMTYHFNENDRELVRKFAVWVAEFADNVTSSGLSGLSVSKEFIAMALWMMWSCHITKREEPYGSLSGRGTLSWEEGEAGRPPKQLEPLVAVITMAFRRATLRSKTAVEFAEVLNDELALYPPLDTDKFAAGAKALTLQPVLAVAVPLGERPIEVYRPLESESDAGDGPSGQTQYPEPEGV